MIYNNKIYYFAILITWRIYNCTKALINIHGQVGSTIYTFKLFIPKKMKYNLEKKKKMTIHGSQCGWGLIINMDVEPTLEKRCIHKPMDVNFKWQHLSYVWFGVGKN